MLSRALTRPIRELIAGTRAIGEGDLSYRIDYDRRDEFADLAQQFNATVGRLDAQRRKLLEVQAGLEDEVARRTSELEDANGRLQRLDHMRMLFLADIGHELRTPLTVLRGEAEVALRGERPIEEHRETLRRIVQLAQQMGRLVEDLLFLAVPDNIALLTLPPYAPELNPVENVWEYLRGNKLAITLFHGYEDIVDTCCDAWNFFIDDPATVVSTTSRNWANVNP